MVTKPRSLKKVRILKQANNKTRYKIKKPSYPICGMCGKKIVFFSQGKQAKTKRRAERPLPNLCSACMRKVILAKIRNEVTPSLKKYADQIKIEPKEGKNENMYVKIAGRDAGDVVKITKIIDDKFVEIQGNVRKKVRKVNRAHLEPLLLNEAIKPLSTKKNVKKEKAETKKNEIKKKKPTKKEKAKISE